MLDMGFIRDVKKDYRRSAQTPPDSAVFGNHADIGPGPGRQPAQQS